MAEMEVWFGVYGEGSVSSVTVACDAKVKDLQEAIARVVSTAQNVIPPRLVTLYLAKKKDKEWLRDNEQVVVFLRGKVDTTYLQMRPSEKLKEEKFFGPNFQPGDGDIHVLVQLPETTATAAHVPLPSLRVGMDANSEKLIDPYERVAGRLKNAREVEQLVDAVRYVAKDTEARPFIVLESSSGMGKTQMAFNLMAREDIQVHYIVCSGVGYLGQPVYKAFAARSRSFLHCVERDLQPNYLESVRGASLLLTKGEYQRDASRLYLHTFEFVLALLNGANTTQNEVCSYDDVQELIQRLEQQSQKKQVVFLDEFPLLERDHDNVEKLRFMRNVFRTLGLPVILSSTNGTARNMIATGHDYSRGDPDVRWCVMVPQMARFRVPRRERRLRDDMKLLVQRSRPLFAKFALDYIRKHKLHIPHDDDKQIISIMDKLTRDLAAQARSWKRSSSNQWFRVGQVCLFLGSHHYKSTRESGNLIQGHFAKLRDRKMFELRFQHEDMLVKWKLKGSGGDLVGEQPSHSTAWSVLTTFPSINEDVLLYLSLLGGKNHRAFTNARGEYVSFYAALQEASKYLPNPLVFSNPEQPSNDGMRLEAVTVGAIVSASHWNGFAGIRLDAFLAEMIYDLGMERPSVVVTTEQNWCSAIPELLLSRPVPFLAPPNTTWPQGLPKALKLGTITRTKNKDRIDFRVEDFLSGECKDHKTALTLGYMKKILKRVPADTQVHVVVTNRLQRSYFQKKSFKAFLSEYPLLKDTLKDTLILQYGMPGDGRVSTISGMDMNEVNDPKRVVLFVAREPPIAVDESDKNDDEDDNMDDVCDNEDDSDEDEDSDSDRDENDVGDSVDGDTKMEVDEVNDSGEDDEGDSMEGDTTMEVDKDDVGDSMDGDTTMAVDEDCGEDVNTTIMSGSEDARDADADDKVNRPLKKLRAGAGKE